MGMHSCDGETHGNRRHVFLFAEKRAECGQGLKSFAYILATGFFTMFNWLLGTQFLEHCKN